MSLFDDLFRGSGLVPNDRIYHITIMNWITTPIDKAADEIYEFIKAAPDNVEGKMEVRLLDSATNNLNADERRKCVMLYGAFKAAQYSKRKMLLWPPGDK